MVGNVDVHVKFSILKDGEYTNFSMAIKIVLLSVCYPIFCCAAVN